MNDLGRLFGSAVLATSLGLLYYGLVPRHDKFLDNYYFSSVPNAHGSYEYPVQPKRRAPATVASNAEFIEARSGFRAGVTLTGVAVLIAALGLLLQRRQDGEPAAMYEVGRIVGIAFLALGLALLYYGQVGP